jgi:hypothetical protein
MFQTAGAVATTPAVNHTGIRQIEREFMANLGALASGGAPPEVGSESAEQTVKRGTDPFLFIFERANCRTQITCPERAEQWRFQHELFSLDFNDGREILRNLARRVVAGYSCQGNDDARYEVAEMVTLHVQQKR